MRTLTALFTLWLVASCAAPYRAGAAAPPEASQGDSSSSMEGFFQSNYAVPTPSEADIEAPSAPARPDVPASQERQVIYSAGLRLVVVSPREAQSAIQAIAREAGGHLQESDAGSITVRVPASAFDPVVERIASLGEVLERSIRASDVTEEMLDLGIRLENARKARERLLEILSRSDKIEDTLKIEAELARVTTEIESIEGRLRYVQSQVAMSTIRVVLEGHGPDRGGEGIDLPFEWVARLGDGLLAGTVQSMPRKPRFLSRGPYFEPPDEFVRYFSSSELVEAMNAEGVRIKLQEQDNYDDGALSFWSALARRALVEGRALALEHEESLGDGQSLYLGTREVAGEPLGYLLVLTRTKKRVYTFEAWGPRAAFERLQPALLKSARSLRP